MNNLLPSIVFLGCTIGQHAATVAATHPWKDDQVTCENPGLFPVDKWSIAGLTIGTSTFVDVRQRLGDAPSVRPVPEESGRKILCYRLGAGSVAVFESGALAPREGEITAMALLEPSGLPFLDMCPTLKDASVSVHPAFTTPGTKRTKFEEVAGASHCSRNDVTTSWAFQSQDGDWNTLSGLKARFVHRRLQWWYVYRVKSQ